MIGETVSHYRITRELGAGGMGVVYEAEDTRLRRTVALKFLPPELVRDPEAKARFIHEAQAASALDHPNVCTIHEIDETADGQLFIAMACYEGETLKEKIAREPLELDEAIDITRQIAEGLAEAHSREIVHRDLKPANIFIARNGLVKILDFGLAKLAGQTKLTQTGTTLGTVAYMPPEQARGEGTDHRGDLWSLGAVLYEMVTGQTPFTGEHQQAVIYAILSQEPDELTRLGSSVPLELERIVKKCLAKDPSRRYQAVRDLLAELDAAFPPLRAGTAEFAILRAAFSSLLRQARKPRAVAAVSVVLILLVIAGIRSQRRSSRASWAREVALPEIARLVEMDEYLAAFDLAEEAERYLSGDRTLLELWPRMSQFASIRTTPADAAVHVRGYPYEQGEWEYLGRTPVENKKLSLGPFWLRIEKEGYEPIERLFFGRSAYVAPETVQELNFTMDEQGAIPSGMVRIRQSQVSADLCGFGGERLLVPEYLIDKREVTNEEFKIFVDAGGYQNPEYWEHEVVKDGRVLTWEEAMAEFRDQTGRPGPSTWQGGTFQEGRDDDPVSGVCWYEAAAYARFMKKSLPTIYHWLGATNTYYASYIIPLGNFRNEGVTATGSGPAGVHGAYDMAGNVKEWCWNSSENRRYILGGAWDEPTYMFFSADAQSPCRRSPRYGFRCVRYQGGDVQTMSALARPFEYPTRDHRWEEPVSDEIFRIYKSHYAYDPEPLDAVIESVDAASPYWRRERITFRAAYDGERVIAILFLPRNVDAPYQTIVYFPGSSTIVSPSSDQLRMANIDFVIMSGRALMYPIYKSTYERHDALESTQPDSSRSYVDHVVRWMNDLRRSVDYLETRDDIDTEKLAFYGYSWGGFLGPIALALEERFKLGVLVAGGLNAVGVRPEASESVFAPHVTVPVLMVNGVNDYIFEVELNQKPMFERLGTPDEDKKHVIFDSGHSVLARSGVRNQAIDEILGWLDRHLGHPSSSAPRSAAVH